MHHHTLRQHFIDQAIDNDVFGSTADARRWSMTVVVFLGLLGGVAAMLLLPEARLTAQLADGEAVRTFSRPDRVVAIIIAMVGAGLLGCAIWPWMVFDRRDVVVMNGLPLSAPGIVNAKLAALSTIVLVFSCGTQLAASIVFGHAFGAGSIVMAFYTAVVHVLVMVSAGVFLFVFITATQAVALLLLGPRPFQKFSAVVQAILTAMIIAAVTYAPDLYYGATADFAGLAGPVPLWLAHGPLAWFLGAYDVLLGSRDWTSVQQAVIAFVVLGVCIGITLAIYPVMYQRLAQVALEQPKPSAQRRRATLIERVARQLARDRTTQAAAAFMLVSLMRSSRQRQMLAVAVGLAAAYCIPSILRWWPHLAKPPIQPPPELLSVPIEAIFILVGALLFATVIPAEPGSGWMWHAAEPDGRRLRSAVRRVTFLVGVLPVVAIMTPVYWIGWGPVVAFWHAAVCIAIGAFVTAVSTIRRRTPPCAWPLSGPGPAPLVMGVWFLGAYYVFTDWFPIRQSEMFGLIHF